MVFREIVSDMIHVDVHWVQPTPERPYHTFITSGMSDRPMAVPARLKNDARFAELMISLPPHWPISEADFGDERNYWPIRWLKILARFPHEYETWLFQSHTVPHGDPPEPFAPNTQFCGWLVLPPLLLPKEFRLLRVSPAKEIHFFAIYPIYKDEMKFKLDYGVDALVDRFVEHDVCEIVDVDRRNVCNIC